MVLELFGEDFKTQLLSELVELNKQAFAEAQRQQSRETKWVSIAELQEKPVGGAQALKLGETRRNSAICKRQKAVSIYMIWKMCNAF